jgi:hypothetical protein
MNLVYAMLMETMPSDEREAFQANLSMSMVEWVIYLKEEAEKERRRRVDVISGVGEIA